MASEKPLIRTVGSIFASNWLAFGLRFLISILTYRTLGATGRGEYSVTIAVSMIVGNLIQFGLPANAPYLHLKRHYTQWDLHLLAWALSGLFAICSIAMYWITPDPTIHAILEATGLQQRMLGSILALTVLVPPTAVSTSLASATASVRQIVLLNTGSALATLAAVLIFQRFAHFSIDTLVVSTAVCQLAAIAGSYFLEWWTSPEKPKLHRGRKRWAAMAKRGLAGTVNSTFNVIFKRLDIVLVNKLIGVESAGLYSVCQHFQEGVLSFPRSSLGVMIGRLSKMPKVEALESYRNSSKVSLMAIAGLALVGSPLVGTMLRYLVTDNDAAMWLGIALFLGGCVQAYSMLLQGIHFAFGNLKWITISTIASGILYLILALSLSRTLSLYALPLALVVSAVVASGILWSTKTLCLQKGTPSAQYL